MKKLSKIVALCLATSFLFTACGKTEKKESNGTKQEEKKKDSGVQDNLVIENEGTPVENATLKIAYVSELSIYRHFPSSFCNWKSRYGNFGL